VTYSLVGVAVALLRSFLLEIAHPMNTPHHSIARSAFRAAWSLALGMVGVAGKREAGNGPAPI
jgi:hypothetical protein